jgi:hypothetical protein
MAASSDALREGKSRIGGQSLVHSFAPGEQQRAPQLGVLHLPQEPEPERVRVTAQQMSKQR